MLPPIRTPAHRRRRRGNYATIMGLLIFAVIAMGAIALDIAYMRMAQLQAQDIADAASQAALIVYRRTSDVDEAERVAQGVVRLNDVAGGPADLGSVTFGTWDQPEVGGGVFLLDGDSPNAVRAEVAREVPFLLAPVLGHTEFQAQGRSTSAARNLHVVLSVDITNSWSPANFAGAREASELFLRTISESAGPYDRIGMNVWSGRYAWEFTPMFNARNAPRLAATRAQWAELRTASKPGTPGGPPRARTCTLPPGNPVNNLRFDSPPPGVPFQGCYPEMPREYLGTDGRNCTFGSECGTDHTVGLAMSRIMFQEEPDDSAFRALIVLTDGIPNNLEASHGQARRDLGYVEDRWREYQAPVPHAVGSIRSQSVIMARQLWDDMRVHVWVVSFVAHEAFMPNMVQGQGYYRNTSDPNALVQIFEDIANSLPLAIVE